MFYGLKCPSQLIINLQFMFVKGGANVNIDCKFNFNILRFCCTTFVTVVIDKHPREFVWYQKKIKKLLITRLKKVL